MISDSGLLFGATLYIVYLILQPKACLLQYTVTKKQL